MDSLTVKSTMLFPSSKDIEISNAMLLVIWNIANELDYRKVPVDSENSVWLDMPSATLRPPDGRNDNHHLKKVLDKLKRVELGGDYKGEEWGAVLVSQWELKQGGSIVRLLIPPAAIRAAQSPKTFTKIEQAASYRLKGHSRTLYAALADKKNMRQKFWEYDLSELKTDVLQVGSKYARWVDFDRYVLTPALKDINEFGTVTVKMTTTKKAKSIDKVRFDWVWKSLDEARVTDEENERHKSARHKKSDGTAPPLTDAENERQAQLAADRDGFKVWQTENGGTYGQYLDWKKTNTAT